MKRILVIDDEELVRFSISEILSNEGYEVVKAENGVQGVALQKAQPFDIIITDMIMPEKGGLEIILELRKDFPELKFIAFSGGGRTRDLNYLRLAEVCGVDLVMTKPFTRNELIWSVNTCLPKAA